MKTLSFQQMQSIEGGKSNPFWNGACIAVDSFAIVGGFLALTGVGAVVLVAASVACVAYSGANALS